MTPFVARYINSGVTYDEYVLQHRQHPAIFYHCRERSYKKLVETAIGLEKPMTDRQFDMLRKCLGGKKELPLPSRHPSGRRDIPARKMWLDWSMRVRLLDVPASKCYVRPNHSRVNFANIAATMLFLEDLFIKTADGKPFIPFSDVVIVAPYAEQIIDYQKKKSRLLVGLVATLRTFPKPSLAMPSSLATLIWSSSA